MKSIITILSTAIIATLVSIPFAALGAQSNQEEHATLARALQNARLSLEDGLLASTREGTPISVKYEIEDGKFQLSVYTLKGDTFREVIVDHTTGAVSKVATITDAGDLAAARRQTDAMNIAKRSLQAATAEVVKNNDGFRAVSAMPRVKEGYPAVEVTLTNGKDWKTVSERLDDEDWLDDVETIGDDEY